MSDSSPQMFRLGPDPDKAIDVSHRAARYWIQRVEKNPDDIIPTMVLEHIDACPECQLAFNESVDRQTSGDLWLPIEAFDQKKQLWRRLLEALRAWLKRLGLSQPTADAVATMTLAGGEMPVVALMPQRLKRRPTAWNLVVVLGGVGALIVVATIGDTLLHGKRHGLGIDGTPLARGGGPTVTPHGKTSPPALLTLRYDAPDPVKKKIARWTVEAARASQTLGVHENHRALATPLSPIATYTVSVPSFQWKALAKGALIPVLQSADAMHHIEVEPDPSGGWRPKRPLAPGEYTWHLQDSKGRSSQMVSFGVLPTDEQKEVEEELERLGSDHLQIGNLYQHHAMVQQAIEELQKVSGDKRAASLLKELSPSALILDSAH